MTTLRTAVQYVVVFLSIKQFQHDDLTTRSQVWQMFTEYLFGSDDEVSDSFRTVLAGEILNGYERVRGERGRRGPFADGQTRRGPELSEGEMTPLCRTSCRRFFA